MPELTEIEKYQIQIQDYQKKLAAADLDNQKLRGQITRMSAEGKGMGAGWIAYSHNPKYTGVSCGIQFRGGVGFVPLNMIGAERTAKELENDFGFRVEEVKDFKKLPEDTKTAMSTSLVDALSQPKSMPGVTE